MRNKLLWKLIATDVPVIGVVILVVWLAIDTLAANYFSTLMETYNISPSETHHMFVSSIHRYLIEASLIALALAVVLSFLLTRKVLKPLSQMTGLSRQIAAGHYGARVPVESRDEVGELAVAFNQMADSLERVEKLRRAMVTDMAHELRTPLTSIRGYLEALADGVVPPGKETYELLQEEILRLVRLVEDLQQLTKAEAARAFLERQEIDLPLLLSQALELHRPQFDNRGVRLEARLDGAPRQIRADRDKLLQILRNLLQNGWQHTPAGETFTVTAETLGRDLRLSFESSGVEIDEADLPHLFERFYRAEKSRSRESGGAGIGLSIVKELAEAHGGRVGAESGQGATRFWIALPT
jgi:two-component system sensor histidine kinase BaeS